MLLEKGFFNAINRGHASPFINFAARSNEGNLEKIAIEEGLATRDKPYTRIGKFPEIQEFPLVNYVARSGSRKDAILIPSMRICGNYCDFCSEHFIKTPDITDSIIESLKEYEQSKKIRRLSFASPSFDDGNINDIQKILSAIKSHPETTIYMDSCQVSDTRKLELIDEFNVTSIYLGLNAISNKSAAYIGRKEEGMVRYNIEEEKKNILKFLSRERKITGKETYTLSIIVSKSDKEKEITGLIHFLLDIYKTVADNPKKNVEININQAIPLPRTKFFEKHSSDFNLEKFSDYSLGRNYSKTLTTYKNKANDFFDRTLFPRYYLGRGTKKYFLIGLQELIFAYEYTYTGKISSYFDDSGDSKKMYMSDIRFIKNPYLTRNLRNIPVIQLKKE